VILALLLLAQDARWAFDGEAGGGEIVGRAEYRDSAVSGKALVCNGVDTLARLKVAPGPEWTVSLWFYACEPADAPVWDWDGLSLSTRKDGALVAGPLKSDPGRLYPGQWFHVAVMSAPAGSGLLVNGEIVAVGETLGGRAADAALQVGGGGGRYFRGLVDDVRVAPRALRRNDVRDLVSAGLPWALQRPRETSSFPEGKFVLEKDEVVAFLGGQNLQALAESGRLEALLAMSAPGTRFRNLAWEGDTVFEQRRDLNFGPWKRYLERSGASVLVVQFGQMESLRGKAGLPAFVEAYGKLLTDFAARTRRIVVLSPTPFEKPAPPLPDLSGRNADVALYASACRELAYKMGFLYVDLSESAVPTRNGVHWTEAGSDAVARSVAKALGVPDRPVASDLLDAIREKNRLWFDHWRPMNWAFLEGDRTDQPSGRDHVDRRLRWFPVEMQDYLPLVRRQEAKIEALLK
jgi:hypothetical protein